MDTDLQKALDALSRDDVIKLTRDVIDIPSPMGGEKALADFLAGRFRELGVDVMVQEV